MGSLHTLKDEDYGIVVMGSSKVGKSTFIKKLLCFNDSRYKLSGKKIDNLFEYREYTDAFHTDEVPKLRYRALETGNLFVMLFSVNDIDSFNFVNKLREQIVETKGNDVSIIFIGLTPEQTCSKQLSRSISFEFADLVISCDFESKYFELLLSQESEFEKVYDEILRYQQNYYDIVKTRLNKRKSSISHILQRLLSVEKISW